MKKLMIAALAISAMVACSKDDSADVVLETSKKSVAINILNTAPTSRAITDTAVGAESLASTKAEDLVFGFCDGAGNLVVAKTIADAKLTNGSYVFHALDQHISQVYVIANGTPKFTKANAPSNINEAHTAWERLQTNAEWKDIIVFGHASAKHALDAKGEEAWCEVDGHRYPLYEASVTVKPFHSRMEVHNIACADLGTKYNKITLNSLVFDDIAQDLGDVQFDATVTPKVNSYSLDGKKVWSWNVEEQVVPDLTLHLTVDEGNNWDIPTGTEARTVNVVNYKAPAGYANTDNVWPSGDNAGCLKKVLPGEIYVLDLTFNESNIYTDASMLCVDVDVTIANWVIVPVTPEFQ
ncbi:MAG: hypothetical protein II214_00380 [Alistipes sp.]|nr:hypothetical protein [Alistipes sp.]